MFSLQIGENCCVDGDQPIQLHLLVGLLPGDGLVRRISGYLAALAHSSLVAEKAVNSLDPAVGHIEFGCGFTDGETLPQAGNDFPAHGRRNDSALLRLCSVRHVICPSSENATHRTVIGLLVLGDGY